MPPNPKALTAALLGIISSDTFLLNFAFLPVGLIGGLSEGAKLAFGGGGQELGMNIIRKANAGDDRVNMITVTNRIGQSLQEEHAGAFPHDKSVSRGIEGRTPTSRRERPELRKTHLGVEAVGPRQAACQHGVGSASLQLVDGQFESVE